ncbi:MAG: ABC transporter permease [Deltaproteobacteria bacterium]|nr:ABC transporter permease [Deltaproteobacteria bacterium]MCW5803746.1 ABC transporter permease [Deltaproteobacteria bacterium]
MTLRGGWSALRRERSAAIGLALAVTLVALAIAGPWFSADPARVDIDGGLSELGAPLGPSEHGPLGTDQLGRDVWARILSGARTSLGIAALATVLSVAFGIAVGLTAAYAGPRVDGVLMRLVDLVLSFPSLLLAILLAALLRESGLGASSAPVIATLAIVGWTTMARALRAKALALARSELVVAARAIGASPARIVLRHILPNTLGLVVALATLAFAQNLLAESVLAYIGLGAPPPAPTWGRMLYEGRLYYRTDPHLILAPGIAIVTAVVAFNLLGEGLRALVDRSARGIEVRA